MSQHLDARPSQAEIETYKSGDIINLGSTLVPLQAVSTSAVNAFIMVPKSIPSGATLSVSGNNNVIRDADGASALGSKAGTITASRYTEYSIQITITANSGTPFTNLKYYFSGLPLTITVN